MLLSDECILGLFAVGDVASHRLVLNHLIAGVHYDIISPFLPTQSTIFPIYPVRMGSYWVISG